MPKASPRVHRTAQVVRITGRIWHGLFDVNVCVIEPAFPGTQLCQGAMKGLP